MSFQKSIEICFAKYGTFQGKATRSEYWWFFLFLILMGAVLGIVDGFMFPVQNEHIKALIAKIIASGFHFFPNPFSI